MSSRLTATMTERAACTPASVSACVEAASPAIAVMPCAVARARASGADSMTTISLGLTPLARSVFTAPRPFTP